MFKVYSIYGNNDKFFTDTFFVKINKIIHWIKSDVKINGKPYFSEENLTYFLEKSSFSNQFKKMKEGESLEIQYGSCSNHYLIVKMKDQEIAALEEIKKKKEELEKVKEQVNKCIPNELSQKVKSLTKDLKKLSSQTF